MAWCAAFQQAPIYYGDKIMKRWIIILSLATASGPLIAAPASATSNAEHGRRHHRALMIKAAATRLAARSIFEADRDRMSAFEPETRRGRRGSGFGMAGSDCGGGQRIISAYYWEGKRTASGQPFNPRSMTAAHRTLPFGTALTVSNPRTGKSVTVVVNDRGPFVSGVSLDLSLGAAQAIGMRGTAAVCVWNS
jgi:rare lipoprotein A (peptidoglycan hydrolase)